MAELKVQEDVLLSVNGLKKYFPVYAGLFRRQVAKVKAVDGVSFTVRRGETLGLVGESGCGKTTIGRTIMRLMEPTDGEVIYTGLIKRQKENHSQPVNVFELDKHELKALRRDMQMIFQDPNASLNPRMTVHDIIKEPFDIHRLNFAPSELEDRIVHLMKSVGLPPEIRYRYPHQFSGGQRQRIGIARALALEPQLIIADEPVSALDVSVQGQVLNLLQDLQEQFGLTYIFIAHDLSVVKHMSNRVAVMYLGRIVELASTELLYTAPKHPYTEALLSAVPVPDPNVRPERVVLSGNVPSPLHPPSGCHFHSRCPYVNRGSRMEQCVRETPRLRQVDNDHWVACHFAEELCLQGMIPPRVNG